VPLPEKDVTVSLIAHAGDLASAPATVRLIWNGHIADLFKPKLYALVVGVSRYDDPSLKLKYAAKDATDFAGALRKQRGGMYGLVDVRLLKDAKATRTNILEGLDWLEHEVTSHDIGIVYLAGHGWTDSHSKFWYLPVEATPKAARALAVDNDDILETMARLAGKSMFFIDACHAAAAAAGREERLEVASRGSIDLDAVIKDFSDTPRGVVGFFSSQGKELWLERTEWGNGAFTKALVEGLGGKADVLDNGRITLSGLDLYIVGRVKQLTAGAQHPVMIRPPTVSDFPIALVR
jgi:uncharacterized caspase-like protein